MAQILKSLHQVALDQGAWLSAQHLLPGGDPIDRVAFGGSHQEMEAIAGYHDAIRKLKRGQGSEDTKKEPKGKGAGKGAGKDKEKEKDGGF